MTSNRISSLFDRFSHYRHSFHGSRYVLFAIASWTPAIIFFNEHVGEIGRINGPSMYPYLNTSYNESLKKDLCWINKWNPTSNLQRGMIVAFRSPYTGSLAIKRVIALEGDEVQTRAPYPFPIAEVPPGHIWVEGDNRDGSKTLDSMHYGPISMNLILGQVTHILWPWKSAGKIPWEQFKGRTRVFRARRDPPLRWN